MISVHLSPEDASFLTDQLAAQIQRLEHQLVHEGRQQAARLQAEREVARLRALVARLIAEMAPRDDERLMAHAR